MSIKTGRAEGNASVTIDEKKCDVCGLCVEVCKGNPLYIEDKQLKTDHNRLFGCIACGHCAAVCPNGAITVTGRTLSPEDLFKAPAQKHKASYKQLSALMTGRRSIREFKNKQVPMNIIHEIIDATATAPMGLPPSDVEILVLRGREKVQEFSHDIIDLMAKYKWIFKPAMQTILRPFLGKEYSELIKTFIEPAINVFIEKKNQGEDWLLYNAPLAMYFHTSPYADPADPFISATYAMLAAESLGLGSCMIGTPAHFLNHSKKIMNKYGIGLKNHHGIAVIFGYPAVIYKKAIKRSLANVKFY